MTENPEITNILDELLAKCSDANWHYTNSSDQVLAWNIPPETGKYLYDTIAQLHPARILELGTSTGYSSIWMGAAATQCGAHIDTIDYYEPKFPIATHYINAAKLSDTITTHHSRIMPFLELAPDTTYDMVFMDADKNSYCKYLPELLRITTPGAILIADNAINMQSNMNDFILLCQSIAGLQCEIVGVGNGVFLVEKIFTGNRENKLL